jgi:hypothetical protein
LVASRRSSRRRAAGYEVNEANELEDTMAPTLAEVPRGTEGRRGCRRRRWSQCAPRALVDAAVPVPVALEVPAATLLWRLSLLPLVGCCRRLEGVCSACVALSPCSVQSAVVTLLPADQRLGAPFLSCSCDGGGRVRRTSRSACVALPPCSVQSAVVTLLPAEQDEFLSKISLQPWGPRQPPSRRAAGRAVQARGSANDRALFPLDAAQGGVLARRLRHTVPSRTGCCRDAAAWCPLVHVARTRAHRDARALRPRLVRYEQGCRRKRNAVALAPKAIQRC